MPYLTPTDNLSPTAVRRVINIPAHYSHLVSGALFSLTEPEAWKQLGDDTPEQAAEKMLGVWWEFVNNMGYIGTVVPYVTAAPPAGVIPCDGGTYNRADYPLLYDQLHADLIIDANTFRTPNLNGRTVIGTGGGYAFLDEVGSETHMLTLSEIPAHAHSSHEHGLTLADPLVGTPLPIPDIPAPSITDSQGGGQAHNNMQPSTALFYGVVAF